MNTEMMNDIRAIAKEVADFLIERDVRNVQKHIVNEYRLYELTEFLTMEEFDEMVQEYLYA